MRVCSIPLETLIRCSTEGIEHVSVDIGMTDSRKEKSLQMARQMSGSVKANISQQKATKSQKVNVSTYVEDQCNDKPVKTQPGAKDPSALLTNCDIYVKTNTSAKTAHNRLVSRRNHSIR